MKLRTTIKELSELAYWKFVRLSEKQYTNHHYKYFFTEYFNLSENDYNNKSVMDIGCGPRGSLEWAEMADERIGFDSLADKYLKLGAEKQNMKYIQGYAENIPFPDSYFDIISSFNSLDHVENIEQACGEISRVLKPGGLFLLIVDVHKMPTLTEPQTVSWNIVKEFLPVFEIISEKHLAVVAKHKIYTNLRAGKILDKSEGNDGVLTAMLRKNN